MGVNLTEQQKVGLRKALEKEQFNLQRAEKNVEDIKARIAGLEAALRG